jgi:hypothetical protein
VKHLKGQIEAIKQLPHPVLAKYSLPTNFEKLSKARLCEIIQRLLADSKPPVPELAKTMAELYDTVVIKPLGWDLIAALPVVSVESLGLPSERGRYYPSISPDKMRFPAARGQDSEGLGFIAVRCVSLENPKDLVVACVYRRFAIAELSWNYRGGSLLQQGSNVQDSDFLKLKNLLLGNTILADDRAPSFRYKMV